MLCDKRKFQDLEEPSHTSQVEVRLNSIFNSIFRPQMVVKHRRNVSRLYLLTSGGWKAKPPDSLRDSQQSTVQTFPDNYKQRAVTQRHVISASTQKQVIRQRFPKAVCMCMYTPVCACVHAWLVEG